MNVKFEWQKNKNVDTTSIALLSADEDNEIPPVTGVHIPTGNTYKVDYFGATEPTVSAINTFIPLDTYIDFQFKKSLDPRAVADVIGGVTHGTNRNVEMIPPRASSGQRQVKHTYKIEKVKISIRDGGIWKDYHPYEALAQPPIGGPLPDFTALKSGYWQKSDLGYNKFRLLAQTPFTYTDPIGNFIPEQAGLSAKTLFCEEIPKQKHCVQFKQEEVVYVANQWHYNNKILFQTKKQPSIVEIFSNQFNIPLSLKVDKTDILEIHLPEPSYCVDLKLFTYGTFVKVAYYRKADVVETEIGVWVQNADYVLVETRTLSRQDLQTTIRYEAIENDASKPPVQKITIESEHGDAEQIQQCKIDLQNLKHEWYDSGNPNWSDKKEEIQAKEAELRALQNKGCEVKSTANKETFAKDLEIIKHNIRNCNTQITALKVRVQLMCRSNPFGGKDSKRCKTAKKDLADKKAELATLQTDRDKTMAILEDWEKYVGKNDEIYCGTYLHEICWLTEEDYLYNQTIPKQADIQADFNAMQDSLERTLCPIWRANSIFRIKVDVKDTVRFSGKTISSQSKSYYCGFKTGGPIGHFDEDKIANFASSTSSSPELKPPKPELPETSLKFYIDFQKSYPNADGELLNAKPLYYENPSLKVFYTRPYVWHFFNPWPAYQGLTALNGQQEILIIDPTEEKLRSDSTVPSDALEALPATTLDWSADPNPRKKGEVKLLNNLLSSDEPCAQNVGGSPIKQPSLGTSVEAKHLLPSKLYTAVINNIFEGKKAEVHRYVFFTSRYANFRKQIESYKLKGADGATRDAVFDMFPGISSRTQASAMRLLVNKTTNTLLHPPELETTYPDYFDRLIEGYLKVPPLEPAICTEFNIVKFYELLLGQSSIEKERKVALWIRSPEPFNDPKIPLIELEKTIEIIENGTLATDYQALFSRDRSQIFLMKTSGYITASTLKVRFGYLSWNGEKYTMESVETEDLTIS